MRLSDISILTATSTTFFNYVHFRTTVSYFYIVNTRFWSTYGLLSQDVSCSRTYFWLTIASNKSSGKSILSKTSTFDSNSMIWWWIKNSLTSRNLYLQLNGSIRTHRLKVWKWIKNGNIWITQILNWIKRWTPRPQLPTNILDFSNCVTVSWAFSSFFSNSLFVVILRPNLTPTWP